MKRKTPVSVVLFMVVLLLAALWGWVWNIVKIVGADDLFTGMIIARIIGVFVAPLGAVLGFL